MKLAFYNGDTPIDQGILDKLSDKYLPEYYENGGHNGVDDNFIHHFWYYVENKLNIKIDFKNQCIEFQDEKDYLAYILKEM